MTRMEEIDDDHVSWDDLEKGSFVTYKDDGVDASFGETRSCLSSVRGCCFALGFKELFGFSNDRAYYSLRDTWRDD